MFEIIMLFAFLFAAASQLFPVGPTTNRARSVRKPRHDREKPKREPDPGQKRQSSRRLQAKRENRAHHFEQVA